MILNVNLFFDLSFYLILPKCPLGDTCQNAILFFRKVNYLLILYGKIEFQHYLCFISKGCLFGQAEIIPNEPERVMLLRDAFIAYLELQCP